MCGFFKSFCLVFSVACCLLFGGISSADAAPPDGLGSSITITAPTASGGGSQVLPWSDDSQNYINADFGTGTAGWAVSDQLGGNGVELYHFDASGNNDYWAYFPGSDLVSWVGGAVLPSAVVDTDMNGWGVAGFRLEASVPEPATVSFLLPVALSLLLRRKSSRESSPRS